jgi:hypothetical protein
MEELMRSTAVLAFLAAEILASGSRASYADSRPMLHDLLVRGYEIKAENVRANVLTITVQKGAKAFICAADTDLIGRILNNKAVSATCVPL